jgi:hypothetical protein
VIPHSVDERRQGQPPEPIALLVTHGDDEVVRAEPFDAIEVELPVLWSDPPAGRG